MTYIPRPEHMKLMKSFFKLVDYNVLNIADIGTGRTSLYTLGKEYGFARIDAYYNDDNLDVIEGIKKDIETVRYNLVKMDITRQYSRKIYDMCLAHLVVSRGKKLGKDEKALLNGIFKFSSKYIIVIDERAAIHEDIVSIAKKHGYNLMKKCSDSTPYRMLMMGSAGDEGYLFKKA